MEKSYSVNFKLASDTHIRAALEILGKNGYRTQMTSGADGESWFYYTDRLPDKKTCLELAEIGVDIR